MCKRPWLKDGFFSGCINKESPSSTRSNNKNAMSKVISLKQLRLRPTTNTGSFHMWRARKERLFSIPAVNARRDSLNMRNDAFYDTRNPWQHIVRDLSACQIIILSYVYRPLSYCFGLPTCVHGTSPSGQINAGQPCYDPGALNHDLRRRK